MNAIPNLHGVISKTSFYFIQYESLLKNWELTSNAQPFFTKRRGRKNGVRLCQRAVISSHLQTCFVNKWRRQFYRIPSSTSEAIDVRKYISSIVIFKIDLQSRFTKNEGMIEYVFQTANIYASRVYN